MRSETQTNCGGQGCVKRGPIAPEGSKNKRHAPFSHFPSVLTNRRNRLIANRQVLRKRQALNRFLSRRQCRSLRRPPIADKRLRHPLRPLDRSQWSRCNRRNELVNLADNLDRRAAHAERRGCGNLDWSLSLAASKMSALKPSGPQPHPQGEPPE